MTLFLPSAMKRNSTDLSALTDDPASPQDDDHQHPHGFRENRQSAELARCSLLDYLQADSRPSFVLDLGPTISSQSRSIRRPRLTFSNRALTTASDLHNYVIANVESIKSVSPTAGASRPYAAWLQDAATLSPFDSQAPLCRHFGHLWTASAVDSRWLVVNGTREDLIIDPTASTRQMHKDGADEASHDVEPFPGAVNDDADMDEAPAQSGVPSHICAELDDIFPSNRLPPSSHLNYIRNFDWAATSLGPIGNWSPQLRQACEMMLANPDPCTIFWGDELAMIWNEPYIVIAGNKHPSMLGQSARLSWGEVWGQYEPLFSKMRIDFQAFKQENAQLLINRKGYLEEGFFNLTVMPVQNSDGSVAGFYEPVIETTRQVLTERRMQILLKISERISPSTSLKDLWLFLLSALKGHEGDIYFAALYSIAPETHQKGVEDTYVLEGSVGTNGDSVPRAPSAGSSCENRQGLLPALCTAHETMTSVVLQTADNSLPEQLIHTLKDWGLKEDCRSIVVSPLKSGTDGSATALLAIGTSPWREYDDEYGVFVQLLVRQIESTITFVKSFEKEKTLLKEQAAYESEVKFQQFAEQAQIGIFIFDTTGRIKFCNDAWLDLCGLTRDETNNPMCWVQTIHPDVRDEMLQYWNKLANSEGPQTFELQYKKPWRSSTVGDDNMSLDRTYVLASAYAEISETGDCTGILGCATDISIVKWAEKIQSQRLTEALELKRQQENFLDITSHEMRNPLNAILHCASELIEQLTLQINGFVPSNTKAAMLNECLDAASTIVYCGKHQKRIIDDVLTVSKLDSDLLSITPLSSHPPDIVKEVLGVFETELRATKIQAVTEISDSYRELVPDAVLLDPHRVIQIIINLFSNAIKFLKGESRRNLKIVVDASKEEPKDELGGVRYVPSGRHRKDPTQHADWKDGEILFLIFSVQDTGPGMTPEEANSLFNRFIQGSPRTHAQYGGSGLGLFISRELAELHGGRIGISSHVGLGSTFDFYVKGRRDLSAIKRASTVADAKTAQSAAPRTAVNRFQESESLPPTLRTVSSPSVMQAVRGPSLAVLIVEDNLINQQILKKIMRRQGYEVSIANHGQEALAIVEKSQWRVGYEITGLKLDIILCDVEMPVLDGKATVHRIREWQSQGVLHQNIPVIAVTGNARSEQIKAAKECGFDDVVSKPYEVENLVSRVKQFTQEIANG